MNKKAIIVFSGGQDSTTCLYLAAKSGYSPFLLTFDYGQYHIVELEAAHAIANLFKESSFEIAQIPSRLLWSTSSLVINTEPPEYKEAPGTGIEPTFIPMRNQLFLTLAYNRAVALGAEAIYTGVSQADSGGYPDCRERFIHNMEITSNTALVGSSSYIKIETPLLNLTKKETVELGVSMYNTSNIFKALSYSRTSYSRKKVTEAKDHASILRARGFEQANEPDPLVLRLYSEGHISRLPETDNYKKDLTPYYRML